MTLDFARPAWLLLLAVLPVWWWWIRPGSAGLLVADAEAARRVAGGVGTRLLEAAPALARAAAVASLILALAGPRLVRVYSETVTESVGIAFAIDLSTSMWAEDMADRADRLEVAKETVQRFLDDRTDDVGLVSFAGEALTRLPLTPDTYVVRAAVDALEVGLLVDGTDVAGAITAGTALLRDSGHGTKILILVTDGAHNRAGLAPTTAARAAAAFGVRIYPVAIGKDQISAGNETAMETVLTQAALVTGGRYFRATDQAALDRIYQEMDLLTEPTRSVVERSEAIPLGTWFIVAALPLLVLGSGLRGSRWGVLP